MSKFHNDEWLKYKSEIKRLQQDLKVKLKLSDKHLCDICGKEFNVAYKLRVSIVT